MMRRPSRQRQGAFSTRAFLVVIGGVCFGLGVSARPGFLTLSPLRDEVLHNRGHDIAAEIDTQTRGPGRRSRLAMRQPAIQAG
jgi:hypothetical protein